jgi:ribose/xylose/arabinose/galactoside ABC-type transport system permease subunit
MTTLEYKPLAAPATASLDWREWLKRLGPLVGLLFVFGLFSTLRPYSFLTVFNLRIMLLQTAVVGTAALGMTIIIISGGIDLSVGSNVALCSVIVALLVSAHVPPVLAALGGIGMGLVVGLLMGALITGLRLSPFIVTLGLMGALRGAAKGLADNTTVYLPKDRREIWLTHLLRLDLYTIPPGVWIMLVLAVVVALTLRYTKFGRRVFAIGSNEQTARLCGVRIGLNKLLIYAVASGLVGIAAVLHFSSLGEGAPTSALGMELDVIAAVVIGGASLSGGEGSILGSLAGALMMTAVANGCQKMNYPTWVQEIVTGCIIVIAAALDRLRHSRTG